MKVARSTYYSILNHKASSREIENNILKSKIFKIYCDNRKVYGCIKITRILREDGYPKLSVNRVSRLMKQLGIRSIKKKDFEEVPIEDLPQKPTLAQEREEEFAFVRRKTDRSSWKGKTVHIPQVDTPVDLGKEEKQNLPLVELTDEQKAIFSYFMPVKGMEDQLCKALTVASSHLKNKEKR